MAQRGNEWLAPMLFPGSCDTNTVNQWIEEMLLPELTHPSVIVMDNARFHNKDQMKIILENAGHAMLPLPRYSPDFNPIEQSFAILKKRRQFSPYCDQTFHLVPLADISESSSPRFWGMACTNTCNPSGTLLAFPRASRSDLAAEITSIFVPAYGTEALILDTAIAVPDRF